MAFRRIALRGVWHLDHSRIPVFMIVTQGAVQISLCLLSGLHKTAIGADKAWAEMSGAAAGQAAIGHKREKGKVLNFASTRDDERAVQEQEVEAQKARTSGRKADHEGMPAREQRITLGASGSGAKQVRKDEHEDGTEAGDGRGHEGEIHSDDGSSGRTIGNGGGRRKTLMYVWAYAFSTARSAASKAAWSLDDTELGTSISERSQLATSARRVGDRGPAYRPVVTREEPGVDHGRGAAPHGTKHHETIVAAHLSSRGVGTELADRPVKVQEL